MSEITGFLFSLDAAVLTAIQNDIQNHLSKCTNESVLVQLRKAHQRASSLSALLDSISKEAKQC